MITNVKTSFFDDPAVVLEAKVWSKNGSYQHRKFSKNIVLEGVLFRKSRKNVTFMKSCYYVLTDDRLIYYNVIHDSVPVA